MDWYTLFANALWIGGLAVLLAACSVAYWQAASRSVRWWAVLTQPKYSTALHIGFIGFVAGLALSTPVLAWRVFWFGLVLLLVLRIFYLRKSDGA